MTLNAYRARSLAFPWPPIVYASALLTAILFQRQVPLDVARDTALAAWFTGSALIVVAVCLDLWAMRTLVDKHTAILPNRCSSYLVTCGPYRYTRNPIYLGYVLVMAGFGLITLNPWFFVLAIGLVVWMTGIAVRHEEQHLLARFGFEFERYARRTSRWI
ncbi:methyltransferase family protein [Ensifer soli]|uniref:methyltransferase family protein n=1 Tax=Ciceribacter sp. sgz301302 TaxID=3342379 RepID=UPI0035B9940B